MKLSEVLVRPVITEKVNLQMERSGRYTFVVGKQANKLEIKRSQKLKNISTHINMNITTTIITMNKRNRFLKNKSNRLKKLKRSLNQ